MMIGKMNMNSTDKKGNKVNAQIENFYKNQLVPLAKKLEKDESAKSWVCIDREAQTYFKKKLKRTSCKADFEHGGHSVLSKFKEDATEFWGARDEDDISDLIPALNELANDLYDVESQSEELSSYIYVMF